MARLIDADQMAVDESEAYMSAQVQITDELKWLINFAAHSKIQRLIADTPTVDAVPVVRCRDCRNSYEGIDGRICSYGPCVDCVVPDDFFCRFGERRERNADR
jgi:hypothetical protein